MLKHLASAKGEANTRFINASDIHVFTHRVWALPLAEAQHYGTKLSDALEIRNDIIFAFYSELPHIKYRE